MRSMRFALNVFPYPLFYFLSTHFFEGAVLPLRTTTVLEKFKSQ